MIVFVCIKQVPKVSDIRLDVRTGRIIREGIPSMINPLDKNAIELALEIKEKYGALTIAISMGPPQTEDSLREALAMGIDKAYLLTDRRFAGADTLATSYTLGLAIKKILNEIENKNNFLVICGAEAIDGNTGQVGPELAEELKIPHITCVSKIEITNNKIIAEKIINQDELMIVEAKLPLLITVTKDVNKPRLPTLKDKLKARKAKIEVWSADDLADVADVNKFGFSGSSTRVVKVLVPPMKKRKGQIFKGEDAVDKLIEALEKEGIRLKRDALKRFLEQYDARMNSQIIYPGTQVRTTYLRALELQVRHLARVLLDEEPEYIPFKAR